MSTKPSSAFSWAASGIRVAASAGKAAIGFVTRERPPAQILNDILNQLGAWTQYLSDGAFQGASSFDSTLVVADNQRVGGQPFTFANKTFTADAATDLLTSAAHGLRTGDGPVRVSNTGGGLPGGLSAGTDYWVIFFSANEFWLATTLDNAFAGNNINITAPGGGTQTISATGSTLRPADLRVTRDLAVNGSAVLTHNASLQADLDVTGKITAGGNVSLASGSHFFTAGSGRYKHGTYTKVFSCQVPGAFNVASGFTLNSGTQLADFPIHGFDVGDRIQAVRMILQDNSSGPSTVNVTLMSRTTGGSVTTLASATSNGSGSVQTLTLSGVNVTAGGGKTLYLEPGFNTGNVNTSFLFTFEVDYDLPT